MLISIEPQDQSLAWVDQPAIEALENLAQVAFYGRHFVIAPREVLTILARSAWLSPKARATYQSVLAKYVELAALSSKIGPHLILGEQFGDAEYRPPIWHVPIRLLSTGTVQADAELLAENLDDAKLFAQLGKWYGWHAGFRTLAFSARPAGGGGGTLHFELEHRSTDDGRVTYCISDSDRDHPTARLGNTAAECRRVLPRDTWRTRLIILDGRELENYLPTQWIASTQTGQQNPIAIQALEDTDYANAAELRLYIDIKNGFESCAGVESQDAALGRFVLGQLELLGVRDHMTRECANDGHCSWQEACFTVPALGGTLVRQLAAWLIGRGDPAFTKCLADASPMGQLAKQIFEWGVSLHPLRA